MPAENVENARKEALDALARAVYKLSAADARMRGRSSRTADTLSLSQARALKVLAEQGAKSVGDLAIEVETTGAATTQLVNGLVAAGLVEKRPSEHDKRAMVVSISVLGETLHRKRSDHIAHWMIENIGDYDPVVISQSTDIIIQLADLYDAL
ncbi:MAG: MarR family transcriptional regulator [Novosphingobium sp.]